MFEKLKQYKDLRDKAKQLKDELSQESVVVEFNGVHVVMDGNQEVLRVEIDPPLLAPDQKEKLELACREAFNQALKKIQRLMAEKIRSSGSFNLPGLS
ncbi:MAG: YbaB/EbfC family nucleoid-associated protein [Patescibacteria group bacterium]|nr:YbaB/EbfC family nucleoid-associated protein [Patescibacteria group bacterium]